MTMQTYVTYTKENGLYTIEKVLGQQLSLTVSPEEVSQWIAAIDDDTPIPHSLPIFGDVFIPVPLNGQVKDELAAMIR
jgi:hypothetical protein